ncbi:hypothetical protein ACFYWS_14160 [Streptomyces sp. NPDC002795]|uniref:hypothetical protein n=1 Tax=Streptomyces sp. NPDC002795 TaxID=3364665 RepID=UPI0036BDE6AF
MTRRSERGAGKGARPGQAPSLRAHGVALVAAEPVDAVPLVALQEPGSGFAVVCLRAGSREGRTALDRALADAAGRGSADVRGGARILGSEGDAAISVLADVLGEWGIGRVHTLDPDPVHVAFDESSGKPVHDEPPRQAEAAAVALAAARMLQERTGVPVLVDCLRAGADTTPGAAACRRYPEPVNWLTAGIDGRLTAFAVTAAGVARWYQELPDAGTWRGPELLEGTSLVPGLRVVLDPYGFPHLFGLRRTMRDDGGVDVEVVHCVQHRTGRPPAPWQSLGGPNAGAPAKGREVGFPAAVFDAAGDLYVFVRNFGHSISYRRQGADGIWSAWQHLGGTRIADDLAAVPSPHGGVEVFARARDTAAVVRWYQGQAGAFAEDRAVPFAAVPGTLTPAAEPGGVLFRELRTNVVSVWRAGAQAPCPLGAADGSGPPATVAEVPLDGWRYTLLACAGERGGSAVGVHPEGRAGAGVWWQELGAPSGAVPAAAVDRAGQLTLAARTADGALLVARRTPRHEGLAFDSWKSAMVVQKTV